jgi:hypothetical protein
MFLVLALSVPNYLLIRNSVFAIVFQFTFRNAVSIQYLSPLVTAIHSTVARQRSFKSPLKVLIPLRLASRINILLNFLCVNVTSGFDILV